MPTTGIAYTTLQLSQNPKLLAVAVNDTFGEFFRHFLEMVIFPVEGTNAQGERSHLYSQIMYTLCTT
ncbi:hypothetical protein [Nostoc sp.]|uniref:hypothetical protein n=1 Tax=Nostoc sp. TaxID=1180 RepID=UPI002FFD1E9E